MMFFDRERFSRGPEIESVNLGADICSNIGLNIANIDTMAQIELKRQSN